jgi:hypothetical protein
MCCDPVEYQIKMGKDGITALAGQIVQVIIRQPCISRSDLHVLYKEVKAKLKNEKFFTDNWVAK